MNPQISMAELFTNNMATIISMYNRGQFEFVVAKEIGTGRLIYEKRARLSSTALRPEAGVEWITLKDATKDSCRLATSLSKGLAGIGPYADRELYADSGATLLWPQYSGFANLLKTLLRAHVLHYEVHDYYLKTSETDPDFFINVAAGMATDGVDRCIDHLFKETFGFETDDPGVINPVSEEWVLIALCGVNALYRLHSSGEYERGLKYLRVIEEFIRGELYKRRGERRSFGLLGLTEYLRARLYFGLGRHDLAMEAATASSENYSRKGIRQERAMLQRGEASTEELEETHMISLRRSALTSAMGVAHIQIVGGRIVQALNLLTLSRAALSSGCGEIFARYVDVLWAEGFRARYSSDRGKLIRAARVLRRSHLSFSRLLENSHYCGRSSVELALVYYYLIRTLDRELTENKYSKNKVERFEEKKNRYYGKAIKYCKEALEVTSEKQAGERHNPRLATEAYIIRSRLYLLSSIKHSSPVPGPDFDAAQKEAEEAVRCAEGMTRHRCEALIALGTVYTEQAEDLHRRKNDCAAVKRIAGQNLQEALKINRGENKRLSALCLLRLAQLSLLSVTTYPDVDFYLRQYHLLADEVEYAFVKELAGEIESRARAARVFYVDTRADTWDEYEIKKRLREHLILEFINELAEVIGGEPPTADRRFVDEVKESNIKILQPVSKAGRKPTITSFLANNIRQNLNISSSRVVAKKYEPEFLAKCAMVKANRRKNDG